MEALSYRTEVAHCLIRNVPVSTITAPLDAAHHLSHLPLFLVEMTNRVSAGEVSHKKRRSLPYAVSFYEPRKTPQSSEVPYQDG